MGKTGVRRAGANEDEDVAILGWILTGLAGVGGIYALLSAWLVDRFAARRAGPPTPVCPVFAPVTILKPLHGAEPGLAEALETFFRQDYPAPIQIVFGVQSKTDPAIRIVEALCDRYPAVPADLVVSARVHGDNAKVSNLANMAVSARHRLIVLSDSDIAVSPDYLRRVVSALAGAGVGAVTCLYAGRATVPGLGARLSAMGVSYHFLPNVVTGVSLGLAQPCMGSTIALSADTLAAIGGFEAFADYLADDYEIGRAVRAGGRAVAIPGFAVRHAAPEESLRAWFVHELRWMRTIRLNDPAGHFGSVVTHPLPLALLGCMASGFSVSSLWILTATFLGRAVLKWRIDRCFGAASGPLWLLPIRDICAFCVFLVSLAGGPVEWRGQKLHVAAGGYLSKIRGK